MLLIGMIQMSRKILPWMRMSFIRKQNGSKLQNRQQKKRILWSNYLVSYSVYMKLQFFGIFTVCIKSAWSMLSFFLKIKILSTRIILQEPIVEEVGKRHISYQVIHRWLNSIIEKNNSDTDLRYILWNTCRWRKTRVSHLIGRSLQRIHGRNIRWHLISFVLEYNLSLLVSSQVCKLLMIGKCWLSIFLFGLFFS